MHGEAAAAREEESAFGLFILLRQEEYQRSSGDDKALLMHEICSYCSHFASKVRTTKRSEPVKKYLYNCS